MKESEFCFFTLLNKHHTENLFKSYKDGEKTFKEIIDTLNDEITTHLHLQYQQTFSESYNEGYDDGYDEGYDKGYEEGKDFIQCKNKKIKK